MYGTGRKRSLFLSFRRSLRMSSYHSGAIRGDSTSAKEKHRMRELPGPRGLACRACRMKKHLCDRRKPSCTTCFLTKIDCVYASRKPPVTAPELEDILQRLEHKYHGLLKAKRSHKKRIKNPLKLRPGTSVATGDLEGPLEGQASAGPSKSESFMQFYISELSAAKTEAVDGGYHFDESFLALSSPKFKKSFYHPDESPPSCSSKSSIPHPTRIFNCVPRYPPILSTPQSNLPETSLKPEQPLVEVDNLEVHSMTSTLSPSNHPTPSPHSISNQCQASMHKLWSPPPVHCTNETSQDSHSSPTNVLERARTPQTVIEITHAPTLHFSRATWWDYLTSIYTLRPANPSTPAYISRHDVALEISRDVCGFFKSAPIWLSFINVPLFFDTFHHTELRSAIQPSLVLSILAYSKLLQSERDTKKRDPGERERLWKQSVALKDLAQASFEASYNAGWIDLPLAQAAWILVLYEISAHAHCTLQRMQSAIFLLDNVIRALGLTSLDAMDPRAPMFVPNEVPALGRPAPNGDKQQTLRLGYGSLPRDHLPTSPPASPSSSAAIVKYQATALPTPFDNWRSPADQLDPRSDHGSGDVSACPCEALSFVRSLDLLRPTPSWTFMPRWASNATQGEIRKEEARRLVWSTLVMLGSDAAARQAGAVPQLDLHVTKLENFALLFPGEDNYTSLPDVDTKYSGKESHWALWGRTMLLWLACVRHASRDRPHIPLSGFSVSPSPTDKDTLGRTDAEFAMRVWMETVAIEDALNSHNCSTEQSLMYQSREFLFIIRMQVSGGFRHSIPVAQTHVNFSELDRDSALKWSTHRKSKI
ncbi:hypothetical protein FRB93_009133 [Tulasnella sp. JGI-2019a]|nr:hypothetical protein FRB93_009133 [Tulasnella sp. JGI-2019a]